MTSPMVPQLPRCGSNSELRRGCVGMVVGNVDKLKKEITEKDREIFRLRAELEDAFGRFKSPNSRHRTGNTS